MKNFSFLALFAMAAAVMAAVLLSEAPAVEAACDYTSLTTCMGAFFLGLIPNPDCCTQLKAQQSCFCTYLKDPNLAQYVNSTNAKKIAITCGVTYPTTCP